MAVSRHFGVLSVGAPHIKIPSVRGRYKDPDLWRLPNEPKNQGYLAYLL